MLPYILTMADGSHIFLRADFASLNAYVLSHDVMKVEISY